MKLQKAFEGVCKQADTLSSDHSACDEYTVHIAKLQVMKVTESTTIVPASMRVMRASCARVEMEGARFMDTKHLNDMTAVLHEIWSDVAEYLVSRASDPLQLDTKNGGWHREVPRGRRPNCIGIQISSFRFQGLQSITSASHLIG